MALREGLIDVDNLCANIQVAKQTSKPTTQWKQALKAMQKDPQLLFEALPSAWE